METTSTSGPVTAGHGQVAALWRLAWLSPPGVAMAGSHSSCLLIEISSSYHRTCQVERCKKQVGKVGGPGGRGKARSAGTMHLLGADCSRKRVDAS